MNKDLSLQLPTWMRFSRKLIDKIERPRFIGSFSKEEASMRGMHLAVGLFENKKEGIAVKFYWLIDELDGVIADVRFHAVGPASLLGVAEAASELFIRKNYDQIKRMGADVIEAHLRDKKDKKAIPPEEYSSLNWTLEAAEEASSQCEGIPLSDGYVVTPVRAPTEDGEARPYPGWDELSEKQQMAVLEEVIDIDIRPYIELDAGGIEIVSLTQGRELVIAYKGACTTCYSSVGSTLQAIQQILSAKIHPEIHVVPDSSFLQPPTTTF